MDSGNCFTLLEKGSSAISWNEKSERSACHGLNIRDDTSCCQPGLRCPFPGPFPLPRVWSGPRTQPTGGDSLCRRQDATAVGMETGLAQGWGFCPLLSTCSHAVWLFNCSSSSWPAAAYSSAFGGEARSPCFPWQCHAVTCSTSEVVAHLPRPPHWGHRAPPARQDGWQQNPCTAPGKPSRSIPSPVFCLALIGHFWALERSSWSQAGVFHQHGLAEESLCFVKQPGEVSSCRSGYLWPWRPCFEALMFFLGPFIPDSKPIKMGCWRGMTTTLALQKCRCTSKPGPDKTWLGWSYLRC